MKWSEVKIERLKAQIKFGTEAYAELKAEGVDGTTVLEKVVKTYGELIKELEKTEVQNDK